MKISLEQQIGSCFKYHWNRKVLQIFTLIQNPPKISPVETSEESAANKECVISEIICRSLPGTVWNWWGGISCHRWWRRYSGRSWWTDLAKILVPTLEKFVVKELKTECGHLVRISVRTESPMSWLTTWAFSIPSLVHRASACMLSVSIVTEIRKYRSTEVPAC